MKRSRGVSEIRVAGRLQGVFLQHVWSIDSVVGIVLGPGDPGLNKMWFLPPRAWKSREETVAQNQYKCMSLL